MARRFRAGKGRDLGWAYIDGNIPPEHGNWVCGIACVGWGGKNRKIQFHGDEVRYDHARAVWVCATGGERTEIVSWLPATVLPFVPEQGKGPDGP